MATLRGFPLCFLAFLAWTAAAAPPTMAQLPRGSDAQNFSLDRIAPDLNARLVGLERAQGVLLECARPESQGRREGRPRPHDPPGVGRRDPSCTRSRGGFRIRGPGTTRRTTHPACLRIPSRSARDSTRASPMRIGRPPSTPPSGRTGTGRASPCQMLPRTCRSCTTISTRPSSLPSRQKRSPAVRWPTRR